MALSVLLRNSVRPAGLGNVLRLSPVTITNAARFTQLARVQAPTLAQKCANMKVITSMVQKFSVTPARMSSGHSHAFMWTLERFLSAGLLFIIPATLLLCHPWMDNIFAIAIAAHSHWGTEAICMDYVRPLLFGNVIPKLALFLVYCCSTAILGGLLYYNYNDIGISETCKRIWSNAAPKKEEEEPKKDDKKKK